MIKVIVEFLQYPVQVTYCYIAISIFIHFMKGLIEILEAIPKFIPEREQMFILAPLLNQTKRIQTNIQNRGGGAEKDFELIYVG